MHAQEACIPPASHPLVEFLGHALSARYQADAPKVPIPKVWDIDDWDDTVGIVPLHQLLGCGMLGRMAGDGDPPHVHGPVLYVLGVLVHLHTVASGGLRG